MVTNTSGSQNIDSDGESVIDININDEDNNYKDAPPQSFDSPPNDVTKPHISIDDQIRLKYIFAHSRLCIVLCLVNALLSPTWMFISWYLIFLAFVPLLGCASAWKFKENWMLPYFAYLVAAVCMRGWLTVVLISSEQPIGGAILLLTAIGEAVILWRVLLFRQGMSLLDKHDLVILRKSSLTRLGDAASHHGVVPGKCQFGLPA
eukprot:GHVR01106065.1.p1 GENE.GHVR01106065.1~~GHVR01106065.1.p1  ORF type:complete len:205 (-),score=28.70 GHVR01106065.1:191-805(-)